MERVTAEFGRVPVFYLITRQSAEAELTKIGRASVVAQSQHTSKEKNPADRFTLFRIETGLNASP
jgi:hypothetical protein